jgi:hypothetical protein
LGEPLGKLRHRIGVQFLALQATGGVFFAEIGKVHGGVLNRCDLRRKGQSLGRRLIGPSDLILIFNRESGEVSQRIHRQAPSFHRDLT